MSERCGNEYLEFPEGVDGSFPDDRVRCTEVVLGENTINTCNIAIADVDGDGLEEIALPITIGEDDLVRVYKGDGSILWENREIRLYHAFYGDPARPPGMLHMWYKWPHRHVLTEIVDFDGDGKPEVVVGDGPIYVLDALTGKVKRIIELGGMTALWNVVNDPQRGMGLLVAAADDKKRGPRVTAVDPGGEELWSLATPGRIFTDCMHHGDLDLDGRPEIGFSIGEVQEFWMVDYEGRLRWKKNIPRELGDDEHIDDFLIARILPENRMRGAQVYLVTGPNLLDQDGNVLWSKKDVYDHAQKVLAADFHPDLPGQELYFVQSFQRAAFMLNCDGAQLWRYDNFTRVREGYEHEKFGRNIGRLTTAGDLIDWSGNGRTEIVQAEMAGTNKATTFLRRKKEKPIPEEVMVVFMHILDANGKPVLIFPFKGNPMCARAARATSDARDDIVTVGHTCSRMYIYSRSNPVIQEVGLSYGRMGHVSRSC